MESAMDPRFSDLLARLYAGIEETPPWQRFLEALARWMDASFATLIITTPGERQPATFLTPGSSPAFESAYRETLFAEDPFSGLPDGIATSYSEFMAAMPDEAFAGYRTAIRDSGFDQVLGLDLRFGTSRRARAGAGAGADGYEARFRVSRHASLAPFTPADRIKLQSLAAHLRIAVRLFERLQFAGAEQAAFHMTVQGMGRALIVLGRDLAIVSTNPLAEQVLAEGEGLMRSGHRLVFAQSEHRCLIEQFVRQAGVQAEAHFRITRPVHGDLVVTVRPLAIDAIHYGTGALALVLSRPASDTVSDPDTIRDLLGLTAAEARLVAALAEGGGLVDAARRLGIAHNTAKAQLQSVFAKTGVNRQAQLVALLASLQA
jgi:DNA-binding CsgD family transcriptional regulator